MNNTELDNWWASIPISQKERIARKSFTKTHPGEPVDESQVIYPACTRLWGELDEERKNKIYEHCVHRHDLGEKEWNAGDPYGD